MTEKTQTNVAVRFPSLISLEKYFGNSSRGIYPEMDEKFVMGIVLATKVLHRQVSSLEFAEKKHLEGFWLVKAALVDVMDEDYPLEKSTCLAEIKCKGMIRWGIRRQVKFLERHQEDKNVLDEQPSSSFVKESKVLKLEARKRQLFEEKDEHEEENDNDEYEMDAGEEDEKEHGGGNEDISEQEEALIEETREVESNLEGKRYKLRNNGTRQNAKKVKFKKKRQKKSYDHGDEGWDNCRELLVLGNPKDRWSAER